MIRRAGAAAGAWLALAVPEARRALARRLAEGLAARVGGAPPDLPPERFLEDVARAKAARAQGSGR